ncbi:hypothetical protein O203_16925 [Ectopseudomonas chengduensis]|nr:hypothetical protein O203_16925 [Pseudomonas chengduensis]
MPTGTRHGIGRAEIQVSGQGNWQSVGRTQERSEQSAGYARWL